MNTATELDDMVENVVQDKVEELKDNKYITVK